MRARPPSGGTCGLPWIGVGGEEGACGLAQILGQSGDRVCVPGMRGSALPGPAGQGGSSGVDWSNRCAPTPLCGVSAGCRPDGRSCGWPGLRLAERDLEPKHRAQAEVRGCPADAPAGEALLPGGRLLGPLCYSRPGWRYGNFLDAWGSHDAANL